MSLPYPNIVPENNLRLPDALLIKHGPAQLLGRFVLAADRAARRKGVTLRVSYDFEELVSVNKFYTARDMWYPLLDAFNPECTELNPENAFWIRGENEAGDVVMTHACRVLDWTGTNLAEQACSLWYGRDKGQRCVITAEIAEAITGVVAWGGAAWIHPDFRGRQLAYLAPRISKAYACSRWPIDWSFCYVGLDNVKRGLVGVYGHKNLSYSILYPESPHGEQVVGYSTINEFYGDIADFMDGGAVIEPDDFDELDPTILEHIVTNTSPDGVFQGNISRS